MTAAPGSSAAGPRAPLHAWLPRLVELADGIRSAVRATAAAARTAGRSAELARVVGHGAGDVSFGLDVPAEEAVARWAAGESRRGPFSVLTEESGWRHFGPDGSNADAAGFDHGGPRIVVDPIDGTRNLMADLRSAWTAVALAGPGAGVPRLADVELAVVSELPDSRAARARVVLARHGAGCELREVGADEPARTAPEGRPLVADADARCDRGYFPFFRYAPAQRPALAALEARFFERLARLEGADVATCWDDQYISNAGQLVLLALGTYRAVCDLRAHLPLPDGAAAVTAKPYDVAAAVLCAREAGAVVDGPDGAPLDGPLDARTPVAFVGWANAPTAERLRPHLAAALATSR